MVEPVKPHELTRVEWERRFRERIRTVALDPDSKPLDAEFTSAISEAELESWPSTEDDWLTTPPEEAADEQMSNWEDDGP